MGGLVFRAFRERGHFGRQEKSAADVLADSVLGGAMNSERIIRGGDPSKRRFLCCRFISRPCAYAPCLGCDALCCKFPMRVSVTRQEAGNYLCDHEPGQRGGTYRYRWLKAEFILELKDNGHCVYLNSKTNRCSIYAKRPLACRGWSCGMRIPFLQRENVGFGGSDEF